jgi:hypothetical protein
VTPIKDIFVFKLKQLGSFFPKSPDTSGIKYKVYVPNQDPSEYALTHEGFQEAKEHYLHVKDNGGQLVEVMEDGRENPIKF